MLQIWGPRYPKHHFIIQTDNKTALCNINTLAARSTIATFLVKQLACISEECEITFEGRFIPGALNDIADSISRLHSPGQFLRLSALLSALYTARGGHPKYN